MIQIIVDVPDINILLVNHIPNLLSDEHLELMVTECHHSVYDIFYLPPVYKGHIRNIQGQLAYNYDKLSIENQKRYEPYYKHMQKQDDGKYHIATKTYCKRK